MSKKVLTWNAPRGTGVTLTTSQSPSPRSVEPLDPRFGKAIDQKLIESLKKTGVFSSPKQPK
jgi:hypothetical protein